MKQEKSIGTELKALREEAGRSIRQMADALQMSSSSSYNHYETRYKKDYLPQDLTLKIASILSEYGIDKSRVLNLGSLPQHDPNQENHGFQEGKSPRIDVSVLLDEPNPPANLPGDGTNTVKLAIVGSQIQIAATVDAEGFDELIRRLELARQMIE
ncbi:helix-turn-helix domain-containing protein [Pelagimonas varians]|uniref:Uncharacterized protein n=1 Tax=Pelagimonas varians TaxID=696760 RepID=A0A238JYF6_9RHOB|nr:helix-turn-helix transcriptional regulator [Pelagimonas varians]PYG33100.1 helix-turn-helix protein [Pelagimonas varians]SMX35679.1 hypothetical protein PEV8663_00557 [Pelagimonas varians]